jgi:branched-chain amino acid transport system permease protein
VVVAAALIVGVFDQAVLFSFGSALITDGILLVVIVVVLLLLRARAGRVDSEASTRAASRELRPIPPQLRALPNVQRWIRTGAASLAIVLLALPWLLSPSQTNRASIAMVTAMLALSLLVLTGWAGQISLGQVALAAVGAWVNAVLGWPFPFGLIVAALVGAGVAALIGIPALRLPGLFLAVSTLSFAIAVPAILLNPRYLAKALPDTLPRPVLLGVDLRDERSFFYFVLIFIVLTTLAVAGMRRSRTARALIAARDNEAAAQSFGIDIFRARLGAFAAAGFIAAVAGVLTSYASNGVQAQLFGPEQSVRVFLIAVIGGLGTVAGPLIGAGLVLFTAIAVPVAEDALIPLLALALLLTSPGGLAAAFSRARDAVLRRVAERNGIDIPSFRADGGQLDGPAPIEPVKDTYVPVRYRLNGNWVVPSNRAESVEQVAGRA